MNQTYLHALVPKTSTRPRRPTKKEIEVHHPMVNTGHHPTVNSIIFADQHGRILILRHFRPLFAINGSTKVGPDAEYVHFE